MLKSKNKLSIILRELREEKNLLQKDIASYLNITTSAYGYYEQGKREPDIHVVNSLADFYNVSSDYILGRTNIKKAKPLLTSIHSSLITTIDSLSPESKQELEKYVQLLKLKDLIDKNKGNISLTFEKYTS